MLDDGTKKMKLVGMVQRGLRRTGRGVMRWSAVIGTAGVIGASTVGISVAALAKPAAPSLLGAPTSHDNAFTKDKRQHLQAYLDARHDAKPSMTRKEAASHPIPEPAGPMRRPAAGISQLQQAPFPTSLFAVRNSYQGPVGDTWVQAFAGGPRDASTGRATHGVLRLMSGSPEQLNRVGDFPAPTGFGALRIVQADGDLLKLADDTGKKATFNLRTRTYV